MIPKQPADLIENDKIYFSCEIARIAMRAYLEPDLEAPPRKGITTIVLSVESLHGTMNEIIHDANIFVKGNRDLNIPVHDGIIHYVNVLHELGDNVSLETKILLASELVGGSSYVRGKNPFNDLDFLIRIRSALIHARPDGFVYTDNVALSTNHDRLIRLLLERHLIDDGQNPFTSVVANKRISQWAFNTVSAMARSIVEIFSSAGMRATLEQRYLETYTFLE
ncbi:MAG TPA: hypothetical protein VFT30_06675 [Nitrospira sp.]|nr:hypothetical protein [Nitrospira sp.]